MLEAIAFHAGIVATSAVFMKLTRVWIKRSPKTERHGLGVSEELRYDGMIPIMIMMHS